MRTMISIDTHTVKQFLVTVGIVIIMGAASPTARAQAERPNIIVIMADDLGFSDLGCYGGEIRTPNLDALAQNGLRFTQFYNAARCVPSRGSLLTGVYPHQAGVGQMVSPGNRPGYRGRLVDRVVTLAEVLREGGYQTFMSGKWHVTHFDYENAGPTLHKPTWPLQRGFDRFFGHLSGGGSYYDMVSLMKGNDFIESGEDFYLTDAINEHSEHFVREADADAPFFLYIAHYAPHWPLHAFEADIAKYDGVYDVGWDQIRQARYQRLVELGIIDQNIALSERSDEIPAWENADHKEWEARRMAVHAAMVDRMDQGLGRVFAALKETGRFDNTVIFFLSDNGASAETIQGRRTRHGDFARGGTEPGVMPGPPDTYASFGQRWANVSNTPFRKYKAWQHEGGVATPLIAHWPKGIADRGALRHTPGHVIDFMPTVVELAGVTYPGQFNGHEILPMEGQSLVPVFAQDALDERPLFFEHFGKAAVRLGDWKLVKAGPSNPWELYNMSVDRTERNNLAAKHPERVEALRVLWDQWADRAFVR